MGDEKIPQVEEFVHLGTPIYTTDRAERNMMGDRVAEGYKRVGLIRGLGSRKVGINPLTFSNAYWSAVISKVLYGVELCNSKKESIKTLDDFHMDVAKKIQSLPPNTANIVPLSSVKWIRLSTEITKRCLLFHWQVYNLPLNSVYKQMLVYRIVDIMMRPNENKSGPSVQFVECCKSVGLMTKLKECVFNGEGCSKTVWKRDIKDRLMKIEENEWKASGLITSVAHEYKQTITNIKDGFQWWIVAKWNNKMLPKVKRILKYMVMNIEEGTGITCGCEGKVTLTHIMFECIKISEHRDTEWSLVKRKMPEQMKAEIETMSSEEKSKYIMSCMNGKPVREWQSLYESIAIFCESIIKKWSNVNSDDE